MTADKYYGNHVNEVPGTIPIEGKDHWDLRTREPGEKSEQACGDDPLYLPKDEYTPNRIGPGAGECAGRYIFVLVKKKKPAPGQSMYKGKGPGQTGTTKPRTKKKVTRKKKRAKKVSEDKTTQDDVTQKKA